jgi:ribosomal protein S14
MTITTRRTQCPKCGSRCTRQKSNGLLTLGICRKCGRTWAQKGVVAR